MSRRRPADDDQDSGGDRRADVEEFVLTRTDPFDSDIDSDNDAPGATSLGPGGRAPGISAAGVPTVRPTSRGVG